MARPALGLLHTAQANEASFAALLATRSDPPPALHRVEGELLDVARARGSGDPAVALGVGAAVRALADAGARVVVCTCSTLGQALDELPPQAHVQVLRIDRPMAERATEHGGLVALVVALESTLAPTRRLLLECARRQGKDVRILPVRVASAWEHFEAGRLGDYHREIASAVRLHASVASAVVLAQASMAPAAKSCADLGPPVLSSPESGLDAALALLSRERTVRPRP